MIQEPTNCTNLNNGPLQGLKVLDLSRILAGPYCTQLLGDMGADVIKVERRGDGDDTRTWGPPYVMDSSGERTDASAYFLSANRNKRSISLDINSSEDIATIKQLAAESDVFIENFKVGGLRKYGLDYSAISRDNPRIVYCSITGFGQTGPNAEKPGYDLLAQAYGGAMSITGEPDGQPMKVGVGIADIVCGLYAANAIQAALRYRDRSGLGQHIDVALIDTQIAWLANVGTNYLTSGRLPTRWGNQHPNIVPYQLFEVSDGHVVIAVGNDKQFSRFCNTVGVPQLMSDPRFATNDARVINRVPLVDLLAPHLSKFTKAEIIDALDAADVTCGPVNNIQEVFESDQVAARDMKIGMDFPSAADGKVDLIGNPIKFGLTPVSYRRPPPHCGEHTDEILRELQATR